MCQLVKPYSDFHKASKAPDGLQGHCKECKKILGRKYEKTRSREKKREYQKKDWLRKKVDPAYQAYHKRWLEENAEHVKQKAKEYRKSKGPLLLYTRSNQSASKRGYPGKLTMCEWEAALKQTNFLCIACKENKANSIDHVVPLSRYGTNTYDNIQPMCIRCNLKKGSRVVDFRDSGFVEAIRQEREKS